MSILFKYRLLGTLSLSLHEVVSRGSQNVSSALKSKKGEIIEVRGERGGRERGMELCVPVQVHI